MNDKVKTSRKKLYLSMIKLAIPLIISNFLQNLYNLADTYYMGKLGGIELATASFTSPITQMIIGAGTGFSLGGGVILSQTFGSKNIKKLVEVNTQLIVVNMVIAIIITVLSFGFKYGIPSDADLVFDVRFLPNPYYEQALRPLTGNDRSIQEYVMKNGDGRRFLDKLEDLMQFLIPRYLDEGKNSLVIGIGCTGGKHRSVTITNGLYARLKKLPYTVRMEHRDIEKDARTKGK